MEAFAVDILHLLLNCMIAVSGQPIRASPQNKVRLGFLSGAEQLIDVAFPVADMDATPRRIQQSGRFLQIF